MRFLPWIFRILLILLVIRYVLRLLFPPRRKPVAANRRPLERLGGELVRDPNCGTYVAKEKAIAAGSSADPMYFCSAACRDAYAAAQPVRSR